MSTRPLNTLDLQNSVPSKVAEKYFCSPKFDIWNTRACGNCYFLAYQLFFSEKSVRFIFSSDIPPNRRSWFVTFPTSSIDSFWKWLLICKLHTIHVTKVTMLSTGPFYPFRSVNRTYITRSEDYGKFYKAWNFFNTKMFFPVDNNLFLLKSSENHTFSNYFRGSRS